MGYSCFFALGVLLPGVPAGFLFLLLASPLSKELVKGSEEGEVAVEVVMLSSMGDRCRREDRGRKQIDGRDRCGREKRKDEI